MTEALAYVAGVAAGVVLQLVVGDWLSRRKAAASGYSFTGSAVTNITLSFTDLVLLLRYPDSHVLVMRDGGALHLHLYLGDDIDTSGIEQIVRKRRTDEAALRGQH